MTNANRITRAHKLSAVALALVAAGAAVATPGLLNGVLPGSQGDAGTAFLEAFPDHRFVYAVPMIDPEVALPHQPIPAPPNANTIKNCGEGADLTAMAVYTQTNLFPANQAVAYVRGENGSLCEAGRYATGGPADNGGIVTSGQDSIVAFPDAWLFVLNSASPSGSTGEGSLSVFRVEPDRLVLTSVTSTGGPNPRSVTRHGDWVYVVNAGVEAESPSAISAPESIHGFRLNAAGQLEPLPQGRARTAEPHGDPAQISFSGDGRYLVVAQRHSSTGEPKFIEIFPVYADGSVGAARRHDAGSQGASGFRFDDYNRLYVVHGNFQAQSAGGISSYQVNADATASTITPHSLEHSSDTCWNAISRKTDARYFYTSSFSDSAIAQWRIHADGSLESVDPVAGSSAVSGGTNYFFDAGGMDMAITSSGESEYLYVLNNPVPSVGTGTARIVGFRIASDGDLVQLGESVASGLSNSGFGLTAY